jgi:hypothetical protein
MIINNWLGSFAVCKLRSNFEIIIVYWEGNNKMEFPFDGTFLWIIFIYCATIVPGRVTRSSEKSGKFLKFAHFSDFFWILNFFYICSTALLGRWNTIIIHYCTFTNSYVETILSHIQHVWSNNSNRLVIELVSAELTIRMNDNYSCQRFYQYILSETKLLKKIWKNAKYE